MHILINSGKVFFGDLFVFHWSKCYVSDSPVVCFCCTFSFPCILNSSSSRSFALTTCDQDKNMSYIVADADLELRVEGGGFVGPAGFPSSYD